MARRTVWMLAACMAMAAGPAWAVTGQVIAPVRPGAIAAAPSAPTPAHLFQNALDQAIALQGAIAMGDWASAQLHIADLRLHLYQLSMAGGLPAMVRPGVNQLGAAVDTAAKAVDAQNPTQASDAAYALLGRFFGAIDQMANAGGGGGAGTAAMPLGNPTALEHLHEAYTEAAKAQLMVAQRDLNGARIYLQATRLHLDEAAQAQGAQSLTGTIANLRAQVDRSVGVLTQPRDAALQTRTLVLAFADAFHTAMVPTPGKGGGGGGGQPYKGDVVPQMTDQNRPGTGTPPSAGTAGNQNGTGTGAGTNRNGTQGGGAGTGTHSGQGAQGGRDASDLDRDRPNSSGRQ